MSELLLHIETATTVCSVALSRGSEILSFRDSRIKNSHSTMLTTFIEEVFQESGVVPSQLDAVAVSAGPGSYTGLRIGVASAKGLCYSLDKPLIAIPTLQAMAVGILSVKSQVSGLKCQVSSVKSHVSSVKSQVSSADSIFHLPSSILLCPMLDARRMEVYCALYDTQLQEIVPTSAEIIDESSFSEILTNQMVVFAGDGAAKCKALLHHQPHARFLDDFDLSARYMVSLALDKFRKGAVEDIAYYEPFYLKDFVAGKPRVKGLE